MKFYVSDGKYSYAAGADNGTTHVTAYKTDAVWSAYADRIYPYLPKTVTAAKIATLYLPYEAAIPTGVTAYYCSNIGNNKLTLTPLTEGVIPAETPVIVKSEAAEFNFLGNGGTAAKPQDINAVLSGTADTKTVAENSVLVLGLKDGTTDTYGFYNYTGTTIDANLCYINPDNLPSTANALSLDFSGDVTNIRTAVTDSGEMKVYDLQGHPVQHPEKGLYIVNGRKVVLR